MKIHSPSYLHFISTVWLRMQNPFQFRPGEPFDPANESFQAFMEEFIRRGGTSSAPEELDDEEKAELQKALGFANRRTFEDVNPDAKTMLYPKFAFDLANNWRGNHRVPLDYNDLDRRAKTATECVTVVFDEPEPVCCYQTNVISLYNSH